MVSRNFNIETIAARVAIALLLSFASMSSAFADGIDREWQFESRFYLSGLMTFVEKRNTSTSYNAVSTLLELKISPPARRWYTSLFAEYRFSSEDRFDNISNFGVYWKYNLERWDVTSYLFVNQTPQISRTWYYAGRLRYRLAENHKLGVQAAGVLTRPGRPALELGYYGSLTDTLSLNLITDPGSNGSTNFAARAELVWQVY